ncbi:MAG: thioredoxin [Alphaproteobacteria bacterium]
MSISQATEATFSDEVTAKKGLVLVDFWAEWCGPCKMITPLLEEMAQELGDTVSIVKVNIDENPTPPTEYGVRSIPTLMLFKDGEVVDTKVGVQPKATLVDWINSNK